MNNLYRTYTFSYGGGGCDGDMYYDEEEVKLYEGDTCPECEKGKLKVSSKGNLYCSDICWVKETVNG